jgi:RNA polymerase sigma factor (sigma-70 family)
MKIEERNELVEKHLYLARLVARTLAANLPAHVDVREDLEGEASLLLIEGVEKFDPRQGVPIEKWLKRFLFWRVMELLRRRNLRESMALQLGEFDRPVQPTQEIDIDRARFEARVQQRVRGLGARGRKVVELHYTEGRNMTQVGRAIGRVGRSRASQVHCAVLRELRRDWTMRELADAA